MVPSLDLLPNLVQKSFEQLTMIEEQLVSPISAIMSIFRQRGGQLFNQGYCANFIKDLEPLCKLLPRLSSDISLLVIQKKDINNHNKEFIVNRKRVEICLRYLCKYNHLWKSHGIKISEENLLVLPENDILENLNEIIDENISSDNIRDNGPEYVDEALDDAELNDIHTFVEVDKEDLLESNKIKATIEFLRINQVPLNEYDYEGNILITYLIILN